MITLLRKIIIAVFALMLSVNSFTQSHTMYYIGTVPQSYYLNPATQPECSFYLGLPILSPLQFDYYNSGFSLNDIFWYDAEIDSTIHPLYSRSAADKFLSNLKDVEFLRLGTTVNLASFGFRANEMYFSFDASIKGDEYISYPKDLISLILKGNTNGQVFDFSDLNIELLNYMEFGLNISRNFGSQLTVGIRPKVLYGLATISTQDADISLQTSTEEWVLRSKFSGKMAVTGMEIPVDEEGMIDFDQDFEFDSTITDDPGKNWNKMFGKNRGLGVDIGVHYKPVDDIQLSLSILDLGYIKWNDNPRVISQDGSYTFEGIEWNPANSSDDNWDDRVLDTIESNLSLEGADNAFTTSLRPKIFMGGRLFITPGFDVGILSKTEFLKSKVNQNIILLADWHPIRSFSLSASYSILNKSYSSFGLGMGLKLGPFNMYIISDYIPMLRDDLKNSDIPFIPVDLYNANLRFGLNLVFGCNKNKKLSQDKPLLNSTNWMF